MLSVLIAVRRLSVKFKMETRLVGVFLSPLLSCTRIVDNAVVLNVFENLRTFSQH